MSVVVSATMEAAVPFNAKPCIGFLSFDRSKIATSPVAAIDVYRPWPPFF
jgi:hypothetical protein